MADRRALAAAIGLVVILGGGASAVAAMTGSSTPTDVEAAAPMTTTGVGSSTIDASPDEWRDGAGEPIDAITEVSSSESDGGSADLAPSSSSADEEGIASDARSPASQDWNGSGDLDPGTPDRPGIGLRVEGMSYGTLVSLARSVGITPGEPETTEDGSITVSITLPDASQHVVRIDLDTDGRVIDASVDGTPIGEFVRRFLTGEIGPPPPTPEPHPEWNLPD